MKMEYEGVYRAILAGLIGSRLSSKELERAARFILRDDDFWMLVSHGLQNYLETANSGWFSEQAELLPAVADSKSDSALVAIFLEKISSRRLSKGQLLSIMGSASKRFARDLANEKLTMRQIVGQFLAQASDDEIATLGGKLGINIAQDAYLAGIDKKIRHAR